MTDDTFETRFRGLFWNPECCLKRQAWLIVITHLNRSPTLVSIVSSSTVVAGRYPTLPPTFPFAPVTAEVCSWTQVVLYWSVTL